ncbi:carbohydrate kinase family protein [Streptomyces sp. LP11]|uniref:Carbohydrate kinase family protein n=1 Tax=Streptomyces pyxinicus TaxID=2970331 RepID=A0ABT2B822_9ACTN|nr:carbohydrate kinase family protein [Streptomyces sp. LP11]MCS0604656.1 carbohydrate kinase family protein [Streptomyces sp. LP11]
MRIAVTGSIATDHLMTFPGRIADQLLADHLGHVSLSFLVDTLEIRDGGVAANIAYGLARLGHRPLLLGAVGTDFGPYGERLAALGVDVSGVHVCPTRHTARFLCTTDPDGNQIASFHPGAMAEAGNIDLAAVLRRGAADLVLIGADDPAAMLRHTQACRTHGTPFAADPSQQLAALDGDRVRQLVEDADHLFTNEYEHALLLAKTGWSRTDVLRRVGTWVTTLGDKGSRVERAGDPPLDVPAVPADRVPDPTGAGDAFRAGYLAALSAGLDTTGRARLGSELATLALTSVGTQTYTVPSALVPSGGDPT